MWTSEMWRKILNWLRKVRMNRRPKRNWRSVLYVKPELEWLGPRIVPTNNACTFLGTVSDVYGTVANWAPLVVNGPSVMPDGSGTDTATIAPGVACVLDQSDEVKIAGLTVAGSLTTKSEITVAPGGSLPGGTGLTSVSFGGALDVTTPDIGGVSSTLDTNALTTASSLPGIYNLAIDPSAEVKVSATSTISGGTLIDGGVYTVDDIDAFNGTASTFTGPVAVTNSPIAGSMTAEDQSAIVFGPTSSVVLGADAALGDGKFYVDGPLSVDTNFLNTVSEFYLQNNGSTTNGSIGGTGSVNWNNTEFHWQGGTIGGLTGGGFLIDGNADFTTEGSDPKTLSTTMYNLGSSTVSFGGTGSLTLTTSGLLDNAATSILPMEVSLPTLAGSAPDGQTPGELLNDGTLALNGSSAVDISAPLDNEGTIDADTAAGPLTLSDISGKSILNGKIGLNDDSLTLSGLYTTTNSLEEEYSPTDLTTLTGTLTVASGASADFDHVLLTKAPSAGSGGVITGPGDFSIGADGGETNDSLTWMSGTMSGTGTTLIGPGATLTFAGTGMLSRELDNQGTVEAPSGGTFSCPDSEVVHNEKGGLFDFENMSGAFIPTFNNDGTLELGAGDLLRLSAFTQSSTGTLQSDIASGSSFGTLMVTGAATLDGTLQAQLENGYQPPSGTSFKVLTFGSESGQFATVQPEGWSAQYDANDVMLVDG